MNLADYTLIAVENSNRHWFCAALDQAIDVLEDKQYNLPNKELEYYKLGEHLAKLRELRRDLEPRTLKVSVS